MSGTSSGGDPVTAAIGRATAGLPDADAKAVDDLVRRGLADIDPVVGPDDLAIEIDAALAGPPAGRVDAARRFAAHRRAFRLGRRSWELLTAYVAGAVTDREAVARARELLADIDAALDAGGTPEGIGKAADKGRGPDDDARRRELGDYALEARFVLSGGAGPISLRGGKLLG